MAPSGSPKRSNSARRVGSDKPVKVPRCHVAPPDTRDAKKASRNRTVQKPNGMIRFPNVNTSTFFVSHGFKVLRLLEFATSTVSTTIHHRSDAHDLGPVRFHVGLLLPNGSSRTPGTVCKDKSWKTNISGPSCMGIHELYRVHTARKLSHVLAYLLCVQPCTAEWKRRQVQSKPTLNPTQTNPKSTPAPTPAHMNPPSTKSKNCSPQNCDSSSSRSIFPPTAEKLWVLSPDRLRGAALRQGFTGFGAGRKGAPRDVGDIS